MKSNDSDSMVSLTADRRTAAYTMFVHLLPQLYPIIVRLLAEEAECYAVEARFNLPTFGKVLTTHASNKQARQSLLQLRLVNKRFQDLATSHAFSTTIHRKRSDITKKPYDTSPFHHLRFWDCAFFTMGIVLSQISVTSIPNLQILCVRNFGATVSDWMTPSEIGQRLSNLRHLSHVQLHRLETALRDLEDFYTPLCLPTHAPNLSISWRQRLSLTADPPQTTLPNGSGRLRIRDLRLRGGCSIFANAQDGFAPPAVRQLLCRMIHPATLQSLSLVGFSQSHMLWRLIPIDMCAGLRELELELVSNWQPAPNDLATFLSRCQSLYKLCFCIWTLVNWKQEQQSLEVSLADILDSVPPTVSILHLATPVKKTYNKLRTFRPFQESAGLARMTTIHLLSNIGESGTVLTQFDLRAVETLSFGSVTPRAQTHSHRDENVLARLSDRASAALDLS